MQIECKQVTGQNCTHTITADTADEAKRKMRDHVQTAHPEMTDDEKKDMDMKIKAEF